MNTLTLSITIASSAIGLAIIGYLKFIKKKIRRFVLRNEKIEKYFKEGA
jgi:hypothetical protein